MSRITEKVSGSNGGSYAALFSCLMIRRFSIMIITVIIIFNFKIAFSSSEANEGPDPLRRSMSFLPIAMYDSDIGLGAGVKSVFKNYCSKGESFDIMLFGSTKGEQTYSLSFHLPDDVNRHGEPYPLAIDCKTEYEKILKSNFFGVGNESRDNEFQFPREKTTLEIIGSRGISSRLTIGAGYSFKHYSIYDYNDEWNTINDNAPGVGRYSLNLITTSLSYDSRDNPLNPQKGCNLIFQTEHALGFINDKWQFDKLHVEINHYFTFLSKYHVLAWRLWSERVSGTVPYAELSKIGDSWTARGYKAARFMDNSMMLFTVESRIHLYRKIGGVLFYDTGRVWPDLDKASFRDWHNNIGAGLRLYLQNFTARFDIGSSSEGTRLFINFGHVF